MTDLWLSSVQKRVWNNALSVSHGKSNPRNGILIEKWFKDSILDDIGVSDDDWDHHNSSRWRGDIYRPAMVFSSKMLLKRWFVGFLLQIYPRNWILAKDGWLYILLGLFNELYFQGLLGNLIFLPETILKRSDWGFTSSFFEFCAFIQATDEIFISLDRKKSCASVWRKQKLR